MSNQDVYRKLTPDQLDMHIKEAGLDSCADIDVLARQLPLFSANSMLEVGAGTGRVISCLQDQDFKGKITAIDSNPYFCEFLQKKFGDTITIINQDIRTFLPPPKEYDIILMLWSLFAEFNPDEQQQLLKMFYNALQEKGIVVLDIPSSGTPEAPQASITIQTQTKAGTIKGYLPSQDEIVQWANNAGFSTCDRFPYAPKQDETRSLYVLQK